jgi:hypothetical protein
MKYTTNPLSFIYDGYELKDVNFEDSDNGDTVEVEK